MGSAGAWSHDHSPFHNLANLSTGPSSPPQHGQPQPWPTTSTTSAFFSFRRPPRASCQSARHGDRHHRGGYGSGNRRTRLRTSTRARPVVRVFDRLERIYRRSGANLPSGDARLSHGAEMEGYFWRVTDVARQRVLVVLCGVNRHPDGDWATVAVAAHPGAFVRSTVLDGARAATDRFLVAAGDNAFFADEHHVHVDLGDVALDLELSQQVAWPLKLGAGGIFSAIPFLGQYWQPHVLGDPLPGPPTSMATTGSSTTPRCTRRRTGDPGSRNGGGGARRRASNDRTCASHSPAGC